MKAKRGPCYENKFPLENISNILLRTFYVPGASLGVLNHHLIKSQQPYEASTFYKK